MKTVLVDAARGTYSGPWEFDDSVVLSDGYMTLEDAVAAGIKPEPQAPQPLSVDMWRLRAAMAVAGLSKAVEDWAAKLPNDQRARFLAAWEHYPGLVREDSDVVRSVAKDIGVDDVRLHGLFVAASAITL